MLLRLSLLFEMLSVIVCIHRLYNKKVQFDISAIAVVLLSTFIFEIVNLHGANKVLTFFVYGLVVGYCIWRFKDSVFGAVINTVLTMVFLIIIQFSITVLLHFFTTLGTVEKGLGVNIVTFASCMWLMPKCKVFILPKILKRNTGFLLFVIGSILGISLLLQFWQRTSGLIYLEVFLIAIPIVLLTLVLIGKWGLVQNEKREIEKELFAALSMQEKQEELVKQVRMRQHEFKNHLAAIMATHYTYKSYEKLVDAQRQYCGELINENKYNDLLALENSVVIGFLYQKFQEIELNDIDIKYKVNGKLPFDLIPAHCLVEMIGILLDNAEQALLKNSSNKTIQIYFCEGENECQFRVSNPFRCVGYDEVMSWFKAGVSTKGEGRGLGLYRLDNLCNECGCDVICKNVSLENENWIEFIIRIRKAD